MPSVPQQVVPPNDGLALRSGQEDDYRRDSIERDEKRLAELGRRTVEMYVISHIITEKMEVSQDRGAALMAYSDLIIDQKLMAPCSRPCSHDLNVSPSPLDLLS